MCEGGGKKALVGAEYCVYQWILMSELESTVIRSQVHCCTPHWAEGGTKLGTIGKQKQICNLECIKQLRLILWFWI